MLQIPYKEYRPFRFFMILSIFAIPGCKPDASSHAAEESAYLADYESPADKWGYMDTLGKLVIKATYDDAAAFSEGLAAINQKGKWGFIDMQGSMVIAPVFKSAWTFHEGKARVEPFDRPAHFIDRNGKILASDQWTAIDDFSEGLARVKVGSLFGYIDTSGSLVINAIYSRGWNFQKGLAIVEFEDKLGVIDTRGEKIIPGQFDRIHISPGEDMILCRTEQASVAYDWHGNELASLKEYQMIECGGRLIAVRNGDRMYFFDLLQHKVRTQEAFIQLIYLREKRWAGKKDEGYLLLDADGDALGENGYAQINRFVDGIAVYYKDQRWGYVDRNGIELTGPVFSLAWDYKEGKARAAFEDGIAFIDRDQQLAFYPPLGTLDMRDFSEGFSAIQINR